MLRFRPHHFLCSLGFQGKGYSDRFTANMSRIVMDTLRGPHGDATMIEVTQSTDDICAPCPKRRGAQCTDQGEIAGLDARHATALGLAAGERLSWGAAKARIIANVPPGRLQSLCRGCQWLDLGLCETALSELHAAQGQAADQNADRH